MKSLARMLMGLLVLIFAVHTAQAKSLRIQAGLEVLYGCEDGNGPTVTDVAGVGDPLDAVIGDPAMAVWVAGGGLEFLGGSATTAVPASRLVGAVMASAELTIETWIEPTGVPAAGPEWICGLPGAFAVGQDGADIVLRLITSESDPTGEPGLIASAALDGSRAHIVIARESGGITRIHVDGALAAAIAAGGQLAGWDPAAVLALGADGDGGQPWHGVLRLLAVYDRALDPAEIQAHFAAGPSLAAAGPVARRVAPYGSDTTGDGSPTNPYRTIQRAVDVSADGDVVELEAGTFDQPGDRNIDAAGRNLVVRAAPGVSREECVIDAGGEPGFWFHGGESAAAEVRGVTVSNASSAILIGDPLGVAPAGPTVADCILTGSGFGLEVLDTGSTFTVADCEISGNQTGVSIREDATGGPITNTLIVGNTGDGLETAGTWTVYGFSGFRITDCLIDGNGGHGIHHRSGFGGMVVENTTVSGNAGWGVVSIASQDYGLSLSGGEVTGNLSGGIDTAGSQWDFVSDCEIHGNAGPGLLTGWDAALSVQDNRIHHNASHGIAFGNGAVARDFTRDKTITVRIERNEIHDNAGAGISFEAAGWYADAGITDCLVYRNTGPGVRVAAEPGNGALNRILITGSTIDGNASGLELLSAMPVLVSTTLVTFNDGAGIICGPGADLAVACSDVFGNLGGDVPACLPDIFADSGNLQVDPLYCDRAGGGFTLYASSPCLSPDGVDCGRIGRYGEGCTVAPLITAVADVGGDQGGQVRLSWASSEYDAPGGVPQITGYGVYRLQGAEFTRPFPIRHSTKLAGWDFITEVPARQDAAYQVVVPTLCDSTAAGVCLSTFMVSAMTVDPGVYFDSTPVAGYSVDNLAPGAPSDLVVVAGVGANAVSWVAPGDTDVAVYRVFRTPVWMQSLAPDTAPQVTVASTAWTDLLAAGDNPASYRYWLKAVDFAGNEGPPAAQSVVTAVDEGHVPVRTALRGNAPNPFNPATRIRFDLAAPGPLRVAIYDVGGRLVRTLAGGETWTAGRHVLSWDGRDDSGRSVAAGVFFYRLETADSDLQGRMTLLK